MAQPAPMAHSLSSYINPRAVNIGIEAKAREEIAQNLSKLLADVFSLYLKTHHYHWNVTGPHFQSLHILFEEQYRAMWETTDEIAERIRSLGAYAPGTFAAFQGLSDIADTEFVPKDMEMVRNLVLGHEAVCRNTRRVAQMAEEADDIGTADMLTGFLEFHEKAAWMLRAFMPVSESGPVEAAPEDVSTQPTATVVPSKAAKGKIKDKA